MDSRPSEDNVNSITQLADKSVAQRTKSVQELTAELVAQFLLSNHLSSAYQYKYTEKQVQPLAQLTQLSFRKSCVGHNMRNENFANTNREKRFLVMIDRLH